MTGEILRSKRTQAGIPGSVLSIKAGVGRTHLSDIERGYVVPAAEELARIERALTELIHAKLRLRAVAAEAGWPCQV